MSAPVGETIEQFLSAARPERPGAAAGRHLPVAAVHLGKRPHVDLEPARVIRLVGEPAAVGRDDPVPLGERGSARAASRDGSRPTSSCMTSSPVFGAVSVKISRRPSGDTAVAFCWLGLSVSRSTAPVPSAACQKRFTSPARSELKITRRPSGVHTGRISRPGSNVTRVSVAAAQIPDPDVGLLIGGIHGDARAIG